MGRLTKIVLCFFMLAMLFGCGSEKSADITENKETQGKTDNETETVTIEQLSSFYTPSEKYPDGRPNMWANDSAPEAFKRFREFSVKDLRYSLDENDNEIISPLSFYYAMAILANAADGKTKTQIENALGMTVEDLNNFLSEVESTYQSDMYKYFNKANALWFNTDLGQLKQDYVSVINEYYGDSINEGSFADKKKIVSEVNSWSASQTDGSIDNIVDESDLNDESFFLILNALTGGGYWDFPFDVSDTRFEEFYSRDGSKGLVEMMHRTEFGYWSDEKSEGFIKELDSGVQFVAILPNEGVDIYDYINQMDADTIKKFQENVRYQDEVGTIKEKVGDSEYEMMLVDEHYTNISFPKYQFEKEYDLNNTLIKMGLSDIFDANACDFSKMADGALYVQQAKQKCTIEVDEEKAVATAVTLIEGGKGAGGYEVREKIYHDVVFNRPFLFAMCVGREFPIFLGVVTKLGETAEKAIKIENITGKINIRSLPSTNGEKLGSFAKGEIVYAFETKEAEGYTWYRIGTDRWVADKNGEWIKVLKDE